MAVWSREINEATREGFSCNSKPLTSLRQFAAGLGFRTTSSAAACGTGGRPPQGLGDGFWGAEGGDQTNEGLGNQRHARRRDWSLKCSGHLVTASGRSQARASPQCGHSSDGSPK